MDAAAEVKKYIDMAKRRAYWVVIPFLVSLLGGLSVVLRAEPVYEAQTLILVKPQEVPQSYIRPIVQRGLGERLVTITQQVTSRTNLETIISEHRLYENTPMLLESKVEALRRNIRVNVVGGERGAEEGTFTISFRHRDPEQTRNVANTLASNFISENLRIRESHALGTSGFLADELDSVRRRLEEKELALKEYQEKHFGAMPGQIQTNLSMLSREASQIENLENRLQDAQNRKMFLEQQMVQQRRMGEQMADFSGTQALFDFDPGSGGFESQKIASLRSQLDDLQVRYTESHPDVRRLKGMIERLEAQEAQRSEDSLGDDLDIGLGLPALDPTFMMPSPEDLFRPQLRQVDAEISSIRADIAKSRERLEMYQSRVEETPKREMELLTLRRDYDSIRGLYESLLNRRLEAELAVSMERKQKGEQFRILDPARRPEIPVEPDLRRIMLLTVVLGLGLGGGLGYFRELSDTSYKQPGEPLEDLGLRVLVTIPYRHTQQEYKALRLKKGLKAGSFALGYVILTAAVVMHAKGLENTIGYVTRFLPFVGS